MGRWFRLDDDVVNDPKVQQLDPVLFKAWINILCIASKHGGVLPDMAGCAFMLRTDVREAERVIAALADGGLLDPVKDGLEPHNWTKRQRVSDISTSRVKRHRAKGSKRGGPVSGNGPGNAHETVSGNGNETPPERKRETETERKIRKTSSSAADAAMMKRVILPNPELSRQELEREFFARGRGVLGSNAGGLLTSLLKAKDQDLALASSTLELAATKADPRMFVAAACKPGGRAYRPGSLEDRRENYAATMRALDEQSHANGSRAGSRFDEASDRIISIAHAKRC